MWLDARAEAAREALEAKKPEGRFPAMHRLLQSTISVAARQSR